MKRENKKIKISTIEDSPAITEANKRTYAGTWQGQLSAIITAATHARDNADDPSEEEADFELVVDITNVYPLGMVLSDRFPGWNRKMQLEADGTPTTYVKSVYTVIDDDLYSKSAMIACAKVLTSGLNRFFQENPSKKGQCAMAHLIKQSK